MDEADIYIHFDALRQQTVLAKFGELALACDDLDEILTEACRLVGEALGTELAKVMELQEDGETLLVRAGVGWKPGVVGEVTLTATGDSSEGHALKTGEPMISPDIDKETRFKYPPFLTENGVKAAANVIIIEAKDASGGLRVLQSNARIDLLITDVGLPGGMNGRQLADAARKQRPLLKALFITGYAETAMISHGHLDTNMHVMTKPFAIEALANKVSELIAVT